MVKQQTGRFHQILAEQDTAQATWRWLMREQCAAGLQVQGQPLTQLLRPRLISGADHVRQILALTPVETALAAMAPPTDEPSSHSRLDGFLTADRLVFVEYNAAPPAGPLTQEALAEIFAETPAMQIFTDDYRVQPTPARQQIVEHLTNAWTSGGMPGDGPQVAIVECGESKVSWEFDMLQAELHRQGVPAVTCSTDDLRYEPGQAACIPAPCDA